jgi:hypothetical protein
MSGLKRLLSPGLIVALLALAVALGGIAVAAPHARIGKNKVGARQLKPVVVRTVQGPDFPGEGGEHFAPDRRTAIVNCNPGEIATSGGLYWNQGDEQQVTALYTAEVKPVVVRGEPVGYKVVGASDEIPYQPAGGSPQGPISFTAYAECLKK